MDATELIKKYSFSRSTMKRENISGICPVCGKEADGLGTNEETGESVILHRSCAASSPVANVPFPVKIETRQNLKNHLGMGNQWVERNPSQGFFNGLSDSPRVKARVNFSGHVVYATIERAKKDGLL